MRISYVLCGMCEVVVGCRSDSMKRKEKSTVAEICENIPTKSD